MKTFIRWEDRDYEIVKAFACSFSVWELHIDVDGKILKTSMHGRGLENAIFAAIVEIKKYLDARTERENAV